jgi:hypothetical protein
MATHYRGERIDELLGEIATLEQKLNELMDNEPVKDEEVIYKFAGAYTPLIIAKAKLKALQGESND